MNCNCSNCPACNLCGGCNPHCQFRDCDGGCDHCAAICGRRHDLPARFQEINGLELDMPLRPQPPVIPLPHFFPQLIAPPDMPVMLDRESIIGIGMRNHAGVASKMFDVLAAENINIEMITTSEIKVSCVIDEKYTELAVRTLHSAFELENDNGPVEETGF